jgi:hypothetical protein
MSYEVTFNVKSLKKGNEGAIRIRVHPEWAPIGEA